MRRTVLALIALVAVTCTGCLRSTTVIELKPDGSGTILQETGLTPEAMAMIKGFGAQNQGAGGAGGAGVSDLFTEDQARKAADAMGVTFVSGEPFKTGTLEGYRSRFAFDDIGKVKVNMDQTTAGMSANNGNKREPPFSFAFNKGDASSLLTIQMPEQGAGGKTLLPGLGAGGAEKSDAEKAQTAQALAMMKMMMKGLFVDVTLNVNGRILKTNAPYVDGTRLTLMQIDFDKLLADEAAMKRLEGASDLKALANIPGLKVVSEPKVTIEFAR
jgi:hypothetical protein